MKKKIFIEKKWVLLSIMILTINMVTGCGKSVIGEVYGSEHQYITIAGENYVECNNPGVNKNADRNKKLGVVRFRNDKDEYMTVWSLKGYENNEYIYTLWVYDGAYYKKEQ